MLAKMDAWASELTDGNPAVNVVNGASVVNTTSPVDFNPRSPANALPPSLESPARTESPIMRHFDRWPILGVYVWPNPTGVETRTTFQSEIQWMKNWLTAHLTWIDTQHSRPPAFSHSGGNVPDGTSLTITNPNTGTGTIYYTTDGSDPSSASTGGPSVTLVDAGAAVKWLVPTAANGGYALTAGAGAQQWTGYTDPPNPANWSTGVTGVGYERNPGDTTNYTALIGAGSDTNALMFNLNQTCYLRVAFTIPDQATLDAIATLNLSMKYDDGFRAYLNGTNVTSRNDTHATLTSTPWIAQASQTAVDANAVIYETIDITTPGKPALRIGANVLALHGLNSGAGSSDFIISPLLSYQAAGTGPRVYAGPLTLSGSTLVRARVQISGQWSPITEASFVVNAAPASAANLVVSEFAYDPAPSGSYTSKDLEFIVLRNISAGSVDLSGVQFTAGVAFTLSGTPQEMTLAPGAEAVIAANTTALTAAHGAPPAAVKLLGPFAGALSNDGELLSLRTAGGGVIKEFIFATIAPWPAGAGSSLVLLNPSSNPDHNAAASWRSGGSTPWSDDSGPFTGNWLADSDRDGFTDGIEFALATSSNNPSSVPQIGLTAGIETVGPVTGRYLRLTFRRIASGYAIVTPELSAALNTWQPAAFTRLSSINNGDGTATETWRSTDPVTASAAFARLRASAP